MSVTSLDYVFKIESVLRVIDGDTYLMRVDVGFHLLTLIRVRLLGVDCPESNRGSTFEKQRARDARDAAAAFLTGKAAGDLWVRTQPDTDNFGRWLGRVWRETSGVQTDLAAHLVELRLASLWPSRWRDVYDVQLSG